LQFLRSVGEKKEAMCVRISLGNELIIDMLLLFISVDLWNLRDVACYNIIYTKIMGQKQATCCGGEKGARGERKKERKRTCE